MLWEDWPSFLGFMAGYLPFAVRIKKWIRQEKVQDGYDILRELDGLTVIVNAGGLYMVLRSAIAPRGSSGYRSIGHLSGEYFVYITCVGAYIYSVIVPLLRHWRVCCYKPKHHLLLGHLAATRHTKSSNQHHSSLGGTATPASSAPTQHATISGNSGTPALSTPHHPARFGTGTTSPTNQSAGLRSIRITSQNNTTLTKELGGGTATTATVTPSTAASSSSKPTSSARSARAWDDHELAIAAQNVPSYWQDVPRILRHPLTRDLFMLTSQRFLCPENVKFWLAVDELESIHDPMEQLQDIHARVLTIYHDHIRNNSIFEINISSARRLALARQLGLTSTSVRVTPTGTPTAAARAKAATASHHQHLLTVTGGTPGAPAIHIRTSSRGIAKDSNNSNDSPVGTPRTGSPASPTAAQAAVMRPLLSTPTTTSTMTNTIHISVGSSVGANPSPVQLTPSPLVPVNALGLPLAPPSPPTANAPRSSMTTGGGGGAGNAYRVSNHTAGVATAAHPRTLTQTMSSMTTGPLSPTNVTLGAITTTNASLITIGSSTAGSSGSVPPTANAIASLQHVYESEKAEVARLMRDNLLPHFLSSPKFQAFLATPEARQVTGPRVTTS